MDGTAVLVEVGRTPSDQQVPDAASEVMTAGSYVELWQSKQVGGSPNPAVKAAPPFGFADATQSIRADLEPASCGAPQPDAPQQQR